MNELDENTLIRRMFMTVTLLAAVHLGNDYLENLYSTPSQQVRHLFDVAKKLITDEAENQGICEDGLAHTSLAKDYFVN